MAGESSGLKIPLSLTETHIVDGDSQPLMSVSPEHLGVATELIRLANNGGRLELVRTVTAPPSPNA